MHRALQRAVGKEQPRRDETDVGVPRRNATSARNEPGGGTVSGLSAMSTSVFAPASAWFIARVAAVLEVADHPHAERRRGGEALGNRDAVVARRVVDDHDLRVEITERGRQRFQAGPQMTSGVPGDDPHADFRHSPVHSCRSTRGLNP